ncbi:MAG: class I SAM-dependent methyltransferase [Gemmatimonadetes bacterium]|nr:class I SAM-dependent methyltransferase [Gemmatimonadota bacterium]
MRKPPRHSDRDRLRLEQYGDASNLNARYELHARFSTNERGWHPWVFDQFTAPSGGKILEVGCGAGYLWTHNAERIPAHWLVTLSDFSPGMVRAAKESLSNPGAEFAFVVCDVQAIPFGDREFDAVIANHMLYHVPDRKRAFAEIRRVLKPGGRLYAAANGKGDKRSISELARRVNPNTFQKKRGNSDWFSLESGRKELDEWFSDVRVRKYEDALRITESGPLVAYFKSFNRLSAAELRQLRIIADREIACSGAIHIRKQPGLLIARKQV